ncbi:MAG: Kelch repeat-containing protein [Anaerolineaceae bacterium]
MKTKLFSGLLIVILLCSMFGYSTESVQALSIKADVDVPVPDWEFTSVMHSRRSYFTLSLLPDGRALATGGYYYDAGDHYLNSSEIFNPIDQHWYLVADSMSGPRRNHTATTLLDGRILVVGGENATEKLNTAEIFDPRTNMWSDVPAMSVSRVGHTATRLNDGRVVVVGGCFSNFACTDTVEIYNPLTNSWTYFDDLSLTPRKNHAATLLPDGTVLVTGGTNLGVTPIPYFNTVYLFNPVNNSWMPKASMSTTRSEHFMAVRRDGKVLVVGGYKNSLLGNTFIKSTEIYDPVLNTWTPSPNDVLYGRRGGTAILDPFGNFYLIGGYNADFPDGVFMTEKRDVDSETPWSMFAAIDDFDTRYDHAAIQLINGGFLIAGGKTGVVGETYLNTAEIYQNLSGSSTVYPNTLGDGVYSSAGTLLANGDLLITGGIGQAANDSTRECSKSAYIWSAALDERDDLPSMTYQRCGHTATLLKDGRVVVIGGSPTSTFSTDLRFVEILNGDAWQVVSTPIETSGGTATLLPNGEILTIDLVNKPYGILFNPDTLETRLTTGTYNGQYNGHTATLLPNGKVLIYGSSFENIMELYDPATETFTEVSPPLHMFTNHSATLLEDGRVLFAGGRNTDNDYGLPDYPLFDVRIYNPGTNFWSTMADMHLAHRNHSAVLLLDGKVAVFGGESLSESEMDVVEIFDVSANKWVVSGLMNVDRRRHNAILSPQGNVLIFGGLSSADEPVATLERYCFWNTPIPVWQVSNDYWQPTITEIDIATSGSGNVYTVTGQQLAGDLEASSGRSNQSATNFPFVRVLRLDNQQIVWLKMDGTASSSTFVSETEGELLDGPVMVFSFASGSRSEGKIILSADPPVYIPFKVFLPALIK